MTVGWEEIASIDERKMWNNCCQIVSIARHAEHWLKVLRFHNATQNMPEYPGALELQGGTI